MELTHPVGITYGRQCQAPQSTLKILSKMGIQQYTAVTMANNFIKTTIQKIKKQKTSQLKVDKH